MTQPAYERIYESIRQEILCGNYPVGRKLPGKRELADQYGVSVITVAHALELLTEEGYILPQERSGCYVTYQSSDSFQHSEMTPLRTDLPDQVTLPSSADVEGFPFSLLSRTMRRVLTDQEERILRKSPNQGLPALRLALSQYLARSRGIRADQEQIIIGAGAEYLYGLLTEMLGKNDVWAIEFPSYEKIEQVYSARGIALDRLPLVCDGVDSASLRQTAASVLHVSPYRSYPSDVTASASKRAVLGSAKAHAYAVLPDGPGECNLSEHILPNPLLRASRGLHGAPGKTGSAVPGACRFLFLHGAHLRAVCTDGTDQQRRL